MNILFTMILKILKRRSDNMTLEEFGAFIIGMGIIYITQKLVFKKAQVN